MPQARITRLVFLVVALAAAPAVAGCGVGGQSSPVVLSDEVPADLRSAPAEPTTTAAPGRTQRVEVYFTLQRGLQPVLRDVPNDASVLAAAIDALRRGPNAAESANGFRSAILPDARIQGSRVDGAIALIDLPDSFLTTPPVDQNTSLAQMVYTATAIPGISGVRFTVDGRVVAVPRTDGTLTREPVSRTDFPAQLPARPAG